jgi:hypothetical protein
MIFHPIASSGSPLSSIYVALRATNTSKLHAVTSVLLACTQTHRKYKGGSSGSRDFYFCEEDFGFVSDFAGLLFAVEECAVPLPALADLAGAVVCDLAPTEEADELLWRRPLEVCCTMTGSATCSRLPGSTLMPDILFQRRNWLRETPNRSAMVTSVSPLRAV